MLKVDMHSHIEIPEVFDLLPERYKILPSDLGQKSAVQQERLLVSIREQLCFPERKIKDMQKMGINVTILSITPSQFFYHLDESLVLDVCRIQNDRISEIVQKFPKRFVGMATVPLQNVEVAIKELGRAIIDLKLKGVEIGSNVGARYLGDPHFWPFFEKVKALDVPIFIHPVNVAGAERMKDFYFSNLIGNPLDTTITAAHLIFSGTLDRFPGLKIILSHAGGQIPYIIGRLEHGFEVRPECQEAIKKSPGEYLRQFYFDTISHSPDTLRFLISRVGAERVLMGTDYPYDMGDMNPLQSLESVSGLTAKEKQKIVGQNAISLYRINELNNWN
jgi:aminocarboxymuconate-semialdehyde decarboxylase